MGQCSLKSLGIYGFYSSRYSKKLKFVYLFIELKNQDGFLFVQIAKKLSLNSILVFINII